MKGEGGGAAAAAAGWLAAAAVTAGSVCGLGEQPGRLHFSRRLLAVLHGRPRILVPVRQYSYRIRTYYRSVGSSDRYSCTAVQDADWSDC